MKTKASFLVVLAPTVVFAGVAAAQQEPPPGDEPPPPGYAPPPGYENQQAGYPPPQAMESAPMPVLFGAPGQFVISSDLLISAVSTKESPPSDSIGGTVSSSTTEVRLEPAFDIFVARDLSIGGQLILAFSFADAASSGTGGDSTSSTFGLLPRVAYNFALGSKASIWPRLAVGYIGTSFDPGSGPTSSTSGYRFTFRAFVPFLFHPVPHFFVGGGPIFSTDLVSKYEDVDQSTFTQYGVQTTIGGYFGGR